jgi:hypothetical protein
MIPAFRRGSAIEGRARLPILSEWGADMQENNKSRLIQGVLAGLLAVAGSACSGQPGDGSSGGEASFEAVATTESALSSGAVKIACGGPAVSPFVADEDFSGGSTVTRANTIDVSAVYNPAPTAVYQSQRDGNFTYTLPGFAASSYNKIRLHFADTHWTTKGSRVFNVSINGTQVLSNFDIIGTVGAGNKALIENFTMPASSSGSYAIQFTTVTDAATISGIEVAPVTSSGTPTTANGTAYATQCAQQLVPLPPSFGGSGTCATSFTVGCSAGSWTYSGQLNSSEVSGGQSFNDENPVEIFYYQAGGSTPGLCMTAARQGDNGVAWTNFFGVICQSASGAQCFWDQAGNAEDETHQFSWNTTKNHLVIPSTAVPIASTTQNPTEFVGGTDLIGTSSVHLSQGACSDCHSGRNAFNNHPGTATDLLNRGLVSAANWFPSAWPSPIAPAWDPSVTNIGGPWPENPGPGITSFQNSACFACHNASVGANLGGNFPAISAQTPNYCYTLLTQAVNRKNTSPQGGQCPSGDINCPTGAMPPWPFTPTPDPGDSFATAMLTDVTGTCNAEFRTQWLPPPGGGTLLNAPNTISATSDEGWPATIFGVAPNGTVFTYDVRNSRWVGTNGNVTALSVGADGSAWAIVNGTSGGNPVGYTCAAQSNTCLPSGNCVWECNWSAPNTFTWAQIAAGSGSQIWAVDSSKLGLWEYQSSGFGQYSGSQFVKISQWLSSNAINQIAAGAEGDAWIVSALGNLTHYVSPDFLSVAPPAGSKVVSIAVANRSDVWVASSSGLFRYLGGDSWEQHCLVSGCSNTAFTTVAAGGVYYGYGDGIDVWALDSAGNTYRVDRTKGSALNSIVKVPGTLTHIAAGGQGNVWGINSAGTVYTFQ